MYTKKEIIYSDAYKYLKQNYKICAQTNDITSKITEVTDTLNDFKIVGNTIMWSNGERGMSIIKNGTYNDYKTKFIKSRYSNDDQIAIMLNKDNSEEDLMLYNKMQEWREYAAAVAKKIIETLNK